MAERRDVLREQAWDAALHSFGTAHIFERRARRLRLETRILTFVSLAAPLFVGAAVLAFGGNSWFVSVLVVAASVAVVVQVITATWAVVADWTGELSYATESAAANHSLSNRFKKLASDPPTEASDLRHQLDLLDVEDQARRDQDHQIGLKDKELRRGHRAALRVFEKACSACGEVPISLLASKCGVCGNF